MPLKQGLGIVDVNVLYHSLFESASPQGRIHGAVGRVVGVGWVGVRRQRPDSDRHVGIKSVIRMLGSTILVQALPRSRFFSFDLMHSQTSLPLKTNRDVGLEPSEELEQYGHT
jgi:hypothetical protein